MHNQRRYPIGAEFISQGVHFRVWAPNAQRVQIVIKNNINTYEMTPEPEGYHSLVIPAVATGDLYQFKLDDDDTLYPDPASRAQPYGPHGPSMVVNAEKFSWTDDHWQGVTQKSQVIYEMHIGTFTREGTFASATRELAELAELGITIIELMPVNEFDGEFGWGYDGVGLYAPYHGYGTPNELRKFIDTAHQLGMGVILDVVYNHVGSSGCYLHEFSSQYFSTRYSSEWGDTFNFDGKDNAPVREFILHNALYWIREFHFDGFRFDATQQIFDSSSDHIVATIVRHARAIASPRELYISGENEPQDVRFIISADANGYSLDSLWNDDFHHSAMVNATGRSAAYFSDYRGTPQEFISNLKYGFLYQGQYYPWQKKTRGTPTFGLPPQKFIHYLQNHDQVANGGRGKRLHQLTSPGELRALTCLLLLGPQTPLLFQGQEFSASTPFLYFADNPESLVDVVARGRNEFLHQFPYLAHPEMQNYLSRPDRAATFLNCKLNLAERDTQREIYQLHKDLIHLRHCDPVFNGSEFSHIDGAVIASHVAGLRFFATTPHKDRLLLINFARDYELMPAPEPLLAPPPHCDWQLAWSSESPHYGGHGSATAFSPSSWQLPGLSAAVLVPVVKHDASGAQHE